MGCGDHAAAAVREQTFDLDVICRQKDPQLGLALQQSAQLFQYGPKADPMIRVANVYADGSRTEAAAFESRDPLLDLWAQLQVFSEQLAQYSFRTRLSEALEFAFKVTPE
jgi:hypothetical protein